MSFVLGVNHKLYYQSTGTRAAWPASGAAPDLLEIDNARDVTFSGDAATADVSTRGGGKFKQEVATLNSAEVEFEMVYDTSDAAFTFLRAAWIAGTVFGVAVLDGSKDVDGTQGIWMDAVVTGFEWTQELEEAGKVKVTVNNTYSAVALAAVTVAGSTTTTTAA
jgi:hypothetical protein